jgi:hypothetical protein
MNWVYFSFLKPNSFIMKYILSDDYAKIREDYDITINDLVNYYPNFNWNDCNNN